MFREYEFGRLYVVKGERTEFECAGYLIVRTRGLFTTQSYIGGDYVYYLELDAASPEVLTENRDSLRDAISVEIHKDLQAISRKPEGIEDKPKNPKVLFYGYEYSGDSLELDTPELGTINIEGLYGARWRKSFAILTGKKRSDTNLPNGLLRPKFYKALEVWDNLLDMLTKELGWGTQNTASQMSFLAWSPALIFDLGANGVNMNCSLGYIIGAVPERVLEDEPFALLELAIHELAHCERSGHSQEYESARMEIARTIAPIANKVLAHIKGWQATPAQRGQYWNQ